MSYPYPKKIEVHNFADMASAPNPADWFAENGSAPFWVGGKQYASNGSGIVANGASTLSGAVYNGDGTLASAIIDEMPYQFTYSAGKIATVTGGGVTKTYTWSGDQLQSVEVS